MSTAYFGMKKHTRVTLLSRSEQLMSLHNDIVALLTQSGATFNTPQYNEEGFRPHVTLRPQARLQMGDTVHLSALTVIDLFPEGNPNRRKVLKTISLQG
jgi:2'-5' RNA ligase